MTNFQSRQSGIVVTQPLTDFFQPFWDGWAHQCVGTQPQTHAFAGILVDEGASCFFSFSSIPQTSNLLEDKNTKGVSIASCVALI
mmetsp:Transcript_40811/g.60482  ORF Transcript_40811/g.60482 Transcript_40811/m.60482 type:complete len:85 (-) Transcript_40811:49-303(-)